VRVLVVQLYQLLRHVRHRTLRQDVQQLAQITLSMDEPNAPSRQHNNATRKEANENRHENRPGDRLQNH
jgi:hypothetical protein